MWNTLQITYPQTDQILNVKVTVSIIILTWGHNKTSRCHTDWMSQLKWVCCASTCTELVQQGSTLRGDTRTWVCVWIEWPNSTPPSSIPSWHCSGRVGKRIHMPDTMEKETLRVYPDFWGAFSVLPGLCLDFPTVHLSTLLLSQTATQVTSWAFLGVNVESSVLPLEALARFVQNPNLKEKQGLPEKVQLLTSEWKLSWNISPVSPISARQLLVTTESKFLHKPTCLH